MHEREKERERVCVWEGGVKKSEKKREKENESTTKKSKYF